MGSEKYLGNDPTLAPGGIDAKGQMGDDTLGADGTTDLIVTIENKSSSSLANFRVFVTKLPPTDPNVNVFPAHVHIPELAVNETETCHFLVANHTTSTQEAFRFRVRTDYGLGIKTYNDFELP